MSSETKSPAKQKIDITYFNASNSPTFLEETEVVNFLFTHLEKYGDPKPHIQMAIDYACSRHQGKGGFVVVGKIDNEIVWGTIVRHLPTLKIEIAELLKNLT